MVTEMKIERGNKKTTVSELLGATNMIVTFFF